MGERLYDIQDAMDFLQVSRSTIYNLMQQGRLQSRQVGGQVRFYDSDLRSAVLTREIATPSRRSAGHARMAGPGLPMKFG